MPAQPDSTKILKARKVAKAQPFSELLAAASSGKPLKSWNGMEIYVVDPKTNQVLLNVGGDSAHDPASLTKLAVFYAVQTAIRDKKLKPELKPDEVLPVTAEAHRLSPNKLRGVESITVSLALDAMMTASDNGAAHLLAKRVGALYGKDSVDLLNDTVSKLGLKKTHFINAGGLPAKEDGTSQAGEKTTTAHEMATLIQRIHKDLPATALAPMKKPSVTYGIDKENKPATHEAHHFLLNPSFPGHLPDGYSIAAKTGYTRAANHNIAAMITAPDGRQLVAVVLGSKKRWSPEEVQKLGLMDAAEIKKVTDPESHDIRGNRVRDALVQQLTEQFIGSKARGVELAAPAQAPQPAVPEVRPEPAKVVPAAVIAPIAAKEPPAKDAPHTAVKALPASAQKAVAECRKTIEARTRPGPEGETKVTVPSQAIALTVEEKKLEGLERQLRTAKGKQRKLLEHEAVGLRKAVALDQKFLADLNAIENQANPALYTRANYDAQIARAKAYTDAYVDGITDEKALPPGGRPALKKMFHAIAEGSAGMETGWNPESVKGAANQRPHTGVYQTEWAFVADAKRAITANAAMKAVLDKSPDDTKVLDLSDRLKHVRGLPGTSFAGQGAAFAGMAVVSFRQFLTKGGDPKDFNGTIVYQDHMMGGAGAGNFREKLAHQSDQKGNPGIGKATYNGNYLSTRNPYAQGNDLNPNRTVFADATAKDVQQMMHDKFVHARNKMAKKMEKGELAPERVAAFEIAFLPEWTNNPALKAQDIARVSAQKEMGLQMRAEAEAEVNALKQSKHGISLTTLDQVLCNILRPMPLPGKPQQPPAGHRPR